MSSYSLILQVWEDATKAGGSGATCVLLGLHNIIIMYHKAFSIILLEQLVCECVCVCVCVFVCMCVYL